MIGQYNDLPSSFISCIVRRYCLFKSLLVKLSRFQFTSSIIGIGRYSCTGASKGGGNPAMPHQTPRRGVATCLLPPPKRPNECFARRLDNRKWKKNRDILTLKQPKNAKFRTCGAVAALSALYLLRFRPCGA